MQAEALLLRPAQGQIFYSWPPCQQDILSPLESISRLWGPPNRMFGWLPRLLAKAASAKVATCHRLIKRLEMASFCVSTHMR